jgi:hypothetical protein
MRHVITVEGRLLVSNELFMTAVLNWRALHPDRLAASLEALPRHVADSMAFEGESVDIGFLRERLAFV